MTESLCPYDTIINVLVATLRRSVDRTKNRRISTHFAWQDGSILTTFCGEKNPIIYSEMIL
ncbi:MAG: hypothetical protein ACD_75C00474G0003 [uncultured bacterium]|nr:MAG: hypothetical protein ACD_75C00474G0003 [uncultured bacterium]